MKHSWKLLGTAGDRALYSCLRCHSWQTVIPAEGRVLADWHEACGRGLACSGKECHGE